MAEKDSPIENPTIYAAINNRSTTPAQLKSDCDIIDEVNVLYELKSEEREHIQEDQLMDNPLIDNAEQTFVSFAEQSKEDMLFAGEQFECVSVFPSAFCTIFIPFNVYRLYSTGGG